MNLELNNGTKSKTHKEDSGPIVLTSFKDGPFVSVDSPYPMVIILTV